MTPICILLIAGVAASAGIAALLLRHCQVDPQDDANEFITGEGRL